MLMPPPPGGPNPTSRRRDSPIFEQFDGLPGEIEDAGYMIDNGGRHGNQQLDMYNVGPNANQMRPKDKLAQYKEATLVSCHRLSMQHRFSFFVGGAGSCAKNRL